MKSNKKRLKITNLIMSILLVLSMAAPTFASSHVNQAAVLVRIDLFSKNDVDKFSKLGFPIYAWAYSENNNLSVLSFANFNQLDILAQENLSVRVLDENPQGKAHFLVKLSNPKAISTLRSAVRLLDVVGDQAVVAISYEDFELFAQVELPIKRISTQPIPFQLAPTESDLPSVLVPDPVIQGMIDQITSTKVYSLTGDLTGEWPVDVSGNNYTIATRHSGQALASEKTTQFAYEYFDALGLEVSYHNYYHPFYGSRRNVEAIQEGAAQPDRNLLITAHIDNMPSGFIAPGADDNASGSAGVLLAAEVLSQYDFDCTLRYVLFTGEEQGLFGSHFYAQAAANAHENFRAVLNLDMIAYDLDTQPILDLHTRTDNSSDLAIANIFVEVVEAYNLDLAPHIHQDNMGYSDHDSFWDFGYPAILAIEDDNDFTPYYHTINDRLDTLNLDYFTSFVQAAVGTLAHMGCLIPPDGTVEGIVSEAAGSPPLAGATIEALQNEGVIDSTQSAGDGSYELSLPFGSYTIQASKFGYAPQFFPEVEVTSDQTTTVKFFIGYL